MVTKRLQFFTNKSNRKKSIESVEYIHMYEIDGYVRYLLCNINPNTLF